MMVERVLQGVMFNTKTDEVLQKCRRANIERQRKSRANEKELAQHNDTVKNDLLMVKQKDAARKMEAWNNLSEEALSVIKKRNAERQKTLRAKNWAFGQHSDATWKKLARSKESEEALLDYRRKNAERQRRS